MPLSEVERVNRRYQTISATFWRVAALLLEFCG
jgi:hypothetical protein